MDYVFWSEQQGSKSKGLPLQGNHTLSVTAEKPTPHAEQQAGLTLGWWYRALTVSHY
jgi:hypothetical protein